jgi:divalent metal cation (Fe/Co/Zn/Cd) transporter
MHFGPREILVTMDVQFRPGLPSSELESAIVRLERAIRERIPTVKHIFVEARSFSTAQSQSSVA